MAQYLMALDAGTGSIRAVLFDASGNQIGVSSKEWEHLEDPRYPGSMNFDWTTNWELASGCIKDVIQETSIDSHDIAAISTTCMREGIVLYDQDFHEIWACANVDARSDDEVVELKRQFPDLEKEIYLSSGQTYAFGALPRILWVKNKLPEIYDAACYVSMFNDWLIFKLTGILSTEPSNACTTGIFDLSKRDWDTAFAEKAGLKPDIFPTVYESGTVVAPTCDSIFSSTMLHSGIPVVAGGGDAQLGCIGVGVVNPDEAAVFGGSFWQFEYNTAAPLTDKNCRVRVNCHALPNIWQYEALAFYPGLIMRWYRDGFCQLEKQKALESGKDPYYYMNLEAEKIPAGSYGMLCTFSDVMNYISWRHAGPAFLNFSIDDKRFNRYTFYRAIMENACLVTRGNMELVDSVIHKKPSRIIFASGASKSPLWCQILADVLGIPVCIPKVREATALGAAILAGIGVGIYSDVDSAVKEVVKIEKTYNPNMDNHKVYNDLYNQWKKIYPVQLDLADRHLTQHMWIAPGVN